MRYRTALFLVPRCDGSRTGSSRLRLLQHRQNYVESLGCCQSRFKFCRESLRAKLGQKLVMLTTPAIVNRPVDGASKAVHKNMAAFNVSLQLGLKGLPGNFQLERRGGDLGRLAFLGYCETQRWARAGLKGPRSSVPRRFRT